MTLNMNKYKTLLILCISVLMLTFPSCLNTPVSETEVSDDPSLLSLKFKANDSILHLDEAVFTIDDDNGLVYNVDSLPYLTRVDSVIPEFSFASTAASLLFVEDDTIYLTGNDTIDFTRRPMRLLNYAADGIHSKEYSISVNVHQVNPDLYMWEQMCAQASQREGSAQKMLMKEDIFYFFLGNGLRNYLYTSANAREWTETGISGLPNDIDFRQMQCFDGKFYVVASGMLYVSENGQTWTAQSVTGVAFVDLLFTFHKALWAVVNIGEESNYFAQSADGITWNIVAGVPAQFPVADYAALAFLSRTNTEKAIVMGGVSSTGETLNTRWCTEDGKLWINYSVEQPNFTSLTGASILQYDDKLLMFGGVDKDNNSLNGQLFESVDEGLNWTIPDTLHNRYPQGYEVRNSPSVILDKHQYIYVAGGYTRTKIYTDVWRTKLNKVDFVKK